MTWQEKIRDLVIVTLVVFVFGLWTGTRLFYGIEIDPIDAQIVTSKDDAQKEALIQKRENMIVFPYNILSGKAKAFF